VVQAGESTVRTSTRVAPRLREQRRRTSFSISYIAGHPEYVGVMVTVTAPSGATSTSRTIPSSTTLITGTSGSMTVPSTA
jgi:hypothetical protein